ncbi:hypothetical protein AALA36_21405 [Lachnospiraceae bacterium 66-29]
MKKNQEKGSRCGKVAWFGVGSALTVLGFVVIPPLIKKYGNKVYKKALDAEALNFDNMGPEIVPFEDETKEEE